MYNAIGLSFLFGMGVILVMSTFNYLLGRKILQTSKKQMLAKDERMKVTTEILNAIKFIKANACEDYFYKKLDVKRELEIT